MDSERLETLHKIHEDAGRPGVQGFRLAVRWAGLQISEVGAKVFVASHSQSQIFRGRIVSDGVVPGESRPDMKWQMDLTAWSKACLYIRIYLETNASKLALAAQGAQSLEHARSINVRVLPALPRAPTAWSMTAQ